MAAFALANHHFNLNLDQAKARMRGVRPDPLSSKHKYYVVIGQSRYPVKQVVARVTGTALARFDTNQAVRVCERIGFKVKNV